MGWAALPFSWNFLKTTVIFGTNFGFDSSFITKNVATLSEESGSAAVICCDTCIFQLQFTVWVHKFNWFLPHISHRSYISNILCLIELSCNLILYLSNNDNIQLVVDFRLNELTDQYIVFANQQDI